MLRLTASRAVVRLQATSRALASATVTSRAYVTPSTVTSPAFVTPATVTSLSSGLRFCSPLVPRVGRFAAPRQRESATAPPRQPLRVFCSWKKKDTRNIGGRANALIAAIRDVPDSKEDVYRALDAWAAFQLDFPLLAVKRALRIMQQEGQWKRILQVCKWMLARGQGRTFGTYDLMMEAMAATGRHAELDGTWERIMGRHLDTVPRATFARVMSLYTQQGRPLKVLEVYGSMIELGVNLDEGMVMQVHRALINIGAEQRAEALLQEHQSVLSPPVGKAVRAEKASSSARTL
ncbi:unnamed protein product [Closterium sp. NIES-65]|nr:unnamed protein product [Closterium sp. NIES-65]